VLKIETREYHYNPPGMPMNFITNRATSVAGIQLSACERVRLVLDWVQEFLGPVIGFSGW